jgi:hypothetical protein
MPSAIMMTVIMLGVVAPFLKLQLHRYITYGGFYKHSTKIKTAV